MLVSLIPFAYSSPTYIELHAGIRITPTGSGTILLDSTIQASWAYFSGAYIRFTDFMVQSDGYTADIFGASTSTNANLTINHLLEDELNVTVNAPSGNTSTTNIRMWTDALVSNVTGVDTWIQVGDIFTFTVVHSSPAEVVATVGAGATVPPVTGNVTAGDIWLSATETHYPPYYTSSVDGETDIEDDARGAFLNVSSTWLTDTWDLYVVESWARVNKTAGNATPAQMAVYAYVADGDAGALYGNSSERSLNVGPGVTAYVFTYASPVNVGPNYVFFMLINADAGTGDNLLVYRTDASAKRLDRGALTYPSWPNPLTGEGTSTGETYHVRATVRGDNVNTTTLNQRWGSATAYLARRDIDVTFPGGVGNRWVNFSLPRTEYIHNITYPVGGVWNSTLTTSQYTTGALNDTHNLISIPEATITATDPDFRVYSRTYDYYGTLRGPFYENGTAYPIAVNVTLVSGNGTDTVVINGTDYTWATNDQVFMFYWSLQSGGVRRVYVNEAGETITVFMPEATYATYEFDVRDYTGRLDANAYLEAWRVVNSTEALIERSRIIDAVNDVPLSLVQYAVYNLRVVFSDGTTYVFGYLVTGVDPTPVISIQEIAWGDQAHTSFTHITMEASRPAPTTILASYLDTTPLGFSTSLVTLAITYRDGTAVYSANQSGSASVVFSWGGANSTRDYVVTVTAVHSYYGTISRVWVLDYSRTFSAFPDFDALGNWGFDTTNFLAFGVSLIVALAFSFGGRWLAPFSFMFMVGVFTYLGGTTLTAVQVGIGFVISIAMGVIMGGKAS